MTILTNSHGLPWTEDGVRTSWGKAFDKTSLGDLHFHDLRGTAMTRLALVGCAVPEIASFTGHSMKTVQQTLDAHYLGGRSSGRNPPFRSPTRCTDNEQISPTGDKPVHPRPS